MSHTNSEEKKCRKPERLQRDIGLVLPLFLTGSKNINQSAQSVY